MTTGLSGRAGWLRGLAGILTLSLVACGGEPQFPDFTPLVEKNSPAVVNISAIPASETATSPSSGGVNPLEDIFRRFFDMPPAEGEPLMPDEGGVSLGSGFVLSRDGYILTNHHVIDGASEVFVRLADRRELRGTVVGFDERSDIALLKVDADNLPVVNIGNSDRLKVGEWVLAIGSPFGFDHSVTAGVVSAKGRALPTEQNEAYVPYIQTDVAINPGNSGGPLFNLRGEVMGINAQIFSETGNFAGLSFAIPINDAMAVVGQLKKQGRVARGYLGVRIQELDRDLALALGLDRPYGALVTDLASDGPAARAGLRSGDVILEIGTETVRDASMLQQLIGRHAPQDKVRLRVLRDGVRQKLDVTLAELPALPSAQPGSEPASMPPDDAKERPQNSPKNSVVTLLWQILGLRLVEEEGWVRVTELRADSPAAQAGVRPGDRLLRFAGEPVRNIAGLGASLAALPSGRPLALLVEREGKRQFIALSPAPH